VAASGGWRRGSAAALCALLLAAPAAGDEGQWTPAQIAELDPQHLKTLGLEIAPSELWNDKGGLMRAAVNLSGCSAALVSARGLIATNHHCAYRAIQSQSSPEHDYLKLGFLARKLEQELPAEGYTLRVLSTIRDVSQQVLAAADAASDPRERQRAIERTRKQLLLECEKKDPALRCSVASFDLGSRFELTEAVELRDIRLVWAPPSAIGEYGGEVDNWMWPRHTGDFALLRAYVGPDGKSAEHSTKNVPYQPKQHLAIGASGVRPGDFVAVLGFPGQTRRHLPASEVERQVQQVLPGVVDLFGEWLEILGRAKTRSPALSIKVAALNKNLSNRHKNARGMLEGIARMRLLDRRAREERRLEEWSKQPDRERHAGALAELVRLSERRRAGFQRRFLLEQVARGPNLLAVAIDLVRRARERDKPDIEREEPYMDRGATLLWKLQERRIRDHDPGVDAELTRALVNRARKLPEEQRIASLEKLAPAALEARFRASRLSDPAVAKRLFDGPSADVERSADPMIVLARSLVLEIEAAEAERDAEAGLESRAGPLYFEMLKSVRGGPVYPDANGTLRLSYGTVKGYEPSDGLIAKPQTTLRGAIAKHTGEPPFALPQPVIDAAPAARDSYWADAELGDLPLCFLANLDTTGGNSGSPVINGKGELVGLNFDRVWENIAGDFGYSTERSRNISVDLRFMLWLLDRVDRAGALMAELGATEFRSLPVQRSRVGALRKSDGAPPVEEPPDVPARSGCACELAGASHPRGLSALASIALLLGVRRRRRRGMC
jgi:hypothetical protein